MHEQPSLLNVIDIRITSYNVCYTKLLRIVFPLDRLNELVEEGALGSVAGTHYAFMGHIDGEHIATLVKKTAREVADKLKRRDKLPPFY